LTTDLWTSKSRHGYLGVTVTWLSSDFKFREALLSCDHLPYPHTGEVICEELFRLISRWRLETSIFTVTTDNSANMVKEIKLLIADPHYRDIIPIVKCGAVLLYERCRSLDCDA